MPKAMTDKEKIDELLTRGVEQIFPSSEFLEARLKEGKPLTLYLGIDPTGPTLHLGHAIILRKLRAFQDLGHKVILLIGDFTGMIGDPTDKSAARVRLTREQVLKNAEKYKEQAGRIISFTGVNKAELKYNSKWLGKMTFTDIIEVASHLSVNQMMQREMFRQRLFWKVICEHCGEPNVSPINFGSIEAFHSAKLVGNSFQCSKCKKMAVLDKEHIEPPTQVYLHEYLYPLMQGYDSVAMDVDGEIGGNDQTFNMLVGRDLMKAMRGKEKFVIAMKLLVDPTGKKMGKSEGNMITFEDSPDEMYGKIMSWTDELINPGFDLLTDLPKETIEWVNKEQTPRNSKMTLSLETVSLFYGERAAGEAQRKFIEKFVNHEVPEDIPKIKQTGDKNLLDIIVEAGFVKSNSEGRRVFEQGGVKVDGQVEKDWDLIAAPDWVVQKGKRHFLRVVK